MVHCIVQSVVVVSGALGLYSCLLWAMVRHLPSQDNCHSAAEEVCANVPKLSFPSSIPELQELVVVLKHYRDQNFSYVLMLFSAAYVYKQTFAIPGSGLMNLLGGALLGVRVAGPLVCLLTAIGATLCYLLSAASVAALIQRYQHDRVTKLTQRVKSHTTSSMLLFLISLRVFPGTPNWFLNMASPVAGVPVYLFFLSVLIGLVPYNLVCVSAGATISQMKSVSEIWSVNSFIALVCLAATTFVMSKLTATPTVEIPLEKPLAKAKKTAKLPKMTKAS